MCTSQVAKGNQELQENNYEHNNEWVLLLTIFKNKNNDSKRLGKNVKNVQQTSTSKSFPSGQPFSIILDNAFQEPGKQI